ncbi:MAG TPA: hypothetical protein VFK80_05705 [Limnochordia bacterium]|nr:hypothetical protein [Limnochordia bacterium]
MEIQGKPNPIVTEFIAGVAALSACLARVTHRIGLGCVARVTHLISLTCLTCVTCLTYPASLATIPAEAAVAQGVDDSARLAAVFERAQSRPALTRPIEHEVLAFYYPWYGSLAAEGRWVHWSGVDTAAHRIGSATHYPALGPYDSHDPEVISHHIAEAKAVGIDGFIASWWGEGTFEDQALPLLLAAAERQGFSISAYLETVGETDPAGRAVAELTYLLDRYGQEPAFLKLDGVPVIFVYARVLGQLPATAWPNVIRATQLACGCRFALIADGPNALDAQLFTGIHTYNPVGWVNDAPAERLAATAGAAYRALVQTADDAGSLSALTVIPGYDDTKIRTPGLAADRRGGAVYRTLWEAALAADPDWILISTFNEWHEGTEIEPSREFGDAFLQATEAYAARFHAMSPHAPAAATGLSAQQQAALQNAYAGRTIALWPDAQPLSAAALWLARNRLPVHVLSWNEIAAGQLTPERYPLLVYASGEHYTEHLPDGTDLDAVLTRYRDAGGVLLALASEPYPFYYNERNQAVNRAQTLGLPVEQGWERPPAGKTLHFVGEGPLADLSPIPWPAAGDQRWRPAARGSAGGGYTPLLTLTDETGQPYGDGVAFAGDPGGGGDAYVWFRLLDATQRDALLSDLLGWLAKRLAPAHM